MAKKYLLYIHNDRLFDKESNKSEIVNKLLKAYWKEPDNFKLPEVKEVRDGTKLTGERLVDVIPELMNPEWAGPLMRNPKKGKL